MRFHLLGLILLAGIAVPAAAQREQPVERRVDRLEQEMRAVQRRVFPNGRAQFVEPEIAAERPDISAGAASGDALSNLSARVDALEAQLRSLTGQIEENGHRTRQIEEQLSRLRADLQGRIERIEQQSRPPEPASAPAEEPVETEEPASDEPTTAAAVTDSAEEAYNVGYRLWNQRRYAEAQVALERAATQYPRSRWASWARNLQGRAYLDDGKPANAARILFANYQDNPQGERAADSLFFLGEALTRLNRRTEACRVYDELEEKYPAMRDFIRTRLPQARTAARCATAATAASR